MRRLLLPGLAFVAMAAVGLPVFAQSPGEHGWTRGRHAMMDRSPQERCEERLARQAGHRAYIEAKLNLTAEQRPLWEKLASDVRVATDKQRQFCATLRPATERSSQTVLDQVDRREKFLSARLEAVQSEKPLLQALYQALTPEQRALLDHPHRHS